MRVQELLFVLGLGALAMAGIVLWAGCVLEIILAVK